LLTAPQNLYTITSNYGPVGVAYDSVSGRLFVANQGSGSLTISFVVHRVFLPIILRAPDIALGNSSNAVDRSARAPTDSSATPSLNTAADGDLPGARGIAFDAARNRIYVVGGGGALYVVDGKTMTVTTKNLGNHVDAYSVAYNPVNSKLYIASIENHKIIIVPVTNDVAAEWTPITLTGNNEHPLQEPTHVAVNSITGKAYIADHDGGVRGWVTVVDGSTDHVIKTVYLSGDVYGIAVDSVHNRIYVTSISAARVYVIDGATDEWLGDFQIVRSSDHKKVPLRMVAVNPNVGSDTHLWLTSNSKMAGEDLAGMDRLILVSGNWPIMGQPQAIEVAPPSLEGGLLADPASWFVFASSSELNLVTMVKDGKNLPWLPLDTSPGVEDLYTVVHDSSHPQLDR
jgi:DNA-binding beta-propeller fold protein YncE